MKPKQKLDEFHQHEALDRCHVICSMIDDYLLDHPYIKANQRLKTKIECASMLISEAYQMIGGSNEAD